MEQFLKSITKQSLQVIDTTILLKEYTPISIASDNKELTFNVSSSSEWQDYINNYLRSKNAKVAFGGYLEKRSIYNRSEHFAKAENENERNIHLGIDLWCNAQTPVLAVLAGEVHSFKNNNNYGDYGPTIILKHQIDNKTFYSLYGHLSSGSIKGLRVGDTVKQGQVIAYLGDSSVNGDYAPHLHFQLIIDLQNNFGDYPGVCSKANMNFYQNNCPNPMSLLKL